MDFFLWIIVGFLLFNSLSDRKKLKQLQARVKKLQKTTKGENQMSVLLKELVGSKAKIRFDEEWVKISRELSNGELETKLVRVDNIVDVTVLE
ncbi:hypothetical protein [Streptococcus suis]|uniref:hypothetical protein n=1 Tax=Streptococcus suis TaxID=1307 RepID=UPI000CF70328